MTDDQVIDLWAAGTTLTDTGRQLGVSRSVVAGRIARARVKRADDPRLAPRPPKPKAPKARKPKPADEAVGNAQPLPPPLEPRTIEWLETDECRWPVGETSAGRHTLCGRKTPRYPYCDQHAALAKGAAGVGARFVLPAIGARSR
jgi:hypothetical protein